MSRPTGEHISCLTICNFKLHSKFKLQHYSEPGQEPHFDQGHEENNLLGFQSGIIINFLLQFTGGISK